MDEIATPSHIVTVPPSPLLSPDQTIVRVATRPDGVVHNVLAHSTHPDCCLTAGFRSVVEESDVAVIVVNPEGYLIYANPQAEALLAYRSSELTERHITEIVQAEVAWVVEEFQILAARQTWSGRVLMRPRLGRPVKVSVNAFSNLMTHGGAEHIAFLQPTSDAGPAIARIPESDVASSLSVDELALLQLIACGFSDDEIAGIRGVSQADLAADITAVRQKIGARSRTEAAIVAMRQRLVA